VVKGISAVEQFLDAYRLEETCNDHGWRTSDLSTDVCHELLQRGFRPDVLLLNTRVPLEVLSELADHTDPRIRSLVAMRRASAPLLIHLAEDTEVTVRLRVAYNAKAPEEVLRLLATDRDPEVRRVADERLARYGGS
jgi:hypothetical protein